MNYIKHLTGFFDRISSDERLNPTHISIYMALFQFWNVNRFQNPISISRSEMMRISKIGAKATYHKVIKQLHEYGYIKYLPSYNPFQGSKVHLTIFCPRDEQAMNRVRTKKGTSTSQALVPSINNTNITNNKQEYEHTNENTSSNSDGVNTKEEKPSNLHEEKKHGGRNFSAGRLAGREEKRLAGRNFSAGRKNSLPLPESIEETKAYFAAQNSTSTEAEKFYNYFQSNGWKVGGRTPMVDWQAAARNWILNAEKFEPKKKNTNHHVTTNKNYDEPL